jgi:flotillin
MNISSIAPLLIWGVPLLFLLVCVFYVFSLRRIVPTNLVDIVQRGNRTVSYGVGKGSNVYYEFPGWVPIIGVKVRSLPVSNFDIDLKEYSAYDKDRVPFVVDVKAFFHISDTNKAAEKVESFEELCKQLEDVVKGAVRSILAKSKLEDIMEERSIFGDKFTSDVTVDLQNWGVEPIKNIELMDVRDAEKSTVIHQIMAKRMSAIDMESRTEVAKNRKMAEQAELEARKEVDLTKAETQKNSGEAQAQSEQAIAIARAEATKKSGIAQQAAVAEIAQAERSTAQQQMEVLKVNEISKAEIEKERAIIAAEEAQKRTEIEAQASKYQIEMQASARLEAQRKQAEGSKTIGEAEADVIRAKGLSEAEALQARELAGVTAQTTLAKDIGANEPYQKYLIKIKEVEVSQVVGVAQYESIAKALAAADLKLLINSGDVHSGIGKLSDLFTAKGASQLNGMIEGLKQTEEGKGILSLLENLAPKKAS